VELLELGLERGHGLEEEGMVLVGVGGEVEVAGLVGLGLVDDFAVAEDEAAAAHLEPAGWSTPASVSTASALPTIVASAARSSTYDVKDAGSRSHPERGGSRSRHRPARSTRVMGRGG
jgi:hypothetical protein